MPDYSDAVNVLLIELRAGATRTLEQYETVQGSERVVFRRELIARDSGFAETTGSTGTHHDHAEEALSEEALRARLLVDRWRRARLSLPEPPVEQVLDGVLAQLRGGHAYQTGGGDCDPRSGNYGFGEVLRFAEGGFQHESREWQGPPRGGPDVLVREDIVRYDEPGLRAALVGSDVLGRLVGLRP